MSLPAGASITTIEGKRCTAIPRAIAAFNASANVPATSAAASAADAAVAAATTTPAAAAVAVAATSSISPTVQPVSESPSSEAPVAAATTEPFISQSSSTLVALSTSTPSTASPTTLSTSSPGATQAVISPTASSKVSSRASSTEQVEAAPQTVLSIPTSALSSTTSSTGASSVPAQAVTAESSISKISTSQGVYSNNVVSSNTATVSSQAMPTTIGYIAPTHAGESPVQSSAVTEGGISSKPNFNVGSVAGGVAGGMALIGIFIFFWWRCIKRRKPRDSPRTPLDGTFDRRYEIDRDSLGPTPMGKRWKAQVGGFFSRMRMDLAGLGSTVKGNFSHESDGPTINMDRGNSQFFEPIQQHSRSNSAVVGQHETALTTRDRLAHWWQRPTEGANFHPKLRQEKNDTVDHFTAIRSMSEKEEERSETSPQFTRFLVTKEQELRHTAERHRRSQSTATLPQLGSLGLELNGTSDPFADPFPNVQPTIPNVYQPQEAFTSNPFVDPISNSMSSNYVSKVRRSRGLSESIPKSSGLATRLPSNTVTKVDATPRHPSIAAPSSRYPSTIRNSQDAYRDTLLSSLSISGRNVKGRSDPFDLDQPDLFQTPPQRPAPSQADNAKSPRSSMKQLRVNSILAAKPRIVSDAGTYSSSKYSSGASALLNEWGDPGPDLGHQSAWKRPGAAEEARSIGSNDATQGSASSGQESQVMNVGRAL